MITWQGPTPPPLDPHKRELHNVEMFYTTEQAATDAVRFILLACAIAFSFAMGFFLGGHK
jgi:hypothetical protein